jgi:hypothetical protein
VGRSTIARALTGHGVPPVPELPTSWQTCLRAHWGAIAAADFHLRRTISEFMAHYHSERNHQGLGNELLDRAPLIDGANRIRRRQRLGGLLNSYLEGLCAIQLSYVPAGAVQISKTPDLEDTDPRIE